MIFKEVKFFKIKFKNINMSASSDYYKLIRLRLAKSKQALQKENLSDNYSVSYLYFLLLLYVFFIYYYC